MYFSLLLPNLKSPQLEDTIVGSANEVICLTTTLPAQLNQSEPEFLAHIKMFVKMVALKDRCSSFCLLKNDLFLMNLCSHLTFLNATFYTWDLLLNHKPLMLRYCQSNVCKVCVTQM